MLCYVTAFLLEDLLTGSWDDSGLVLGMIDIEILLDPRPLRPLDELF